MSFRVARGSRRVFRGGSGVLAPQNALVASRYADDPGYRYGRDFGVRFVRRVS